MVDERRKRLEDFMKERKKKMIHEAEQAQNLIELAVVTPNKRLFSDEMDFENITSDGSAKKKSPKIRHLYKHRTSIKTPSKFVVIKEEDDECETDR